MRSIFPPANLARSAGFNRSRCLAAVSIIGLSLAAAQAAQPASWSLRIDPIQSPAGSGSSGPQLSVSSRGVVLSWVERTGSAASLKFSELETSGWTTPRTVASGGDWFVNWADVPSVFRLRDGSLAAHWLQKSGTGTYAYDVRLSHSRDNGRTWAPSFLPHHDGTQTEHGFASLFDAPGGGLSLVWLDGRAMTGGHGEHGGGDMGLRYAAFDRAWTQTADVALDARVCECCPTSVAMTADGPLVAYRDRSPGEVRDIYVTRLENGRWTEPRAVHNDDWRVPACPVNGPAVSARGRDVAVAWFTAKNDEPKAFVAFSSDSGRTFGSPVRLDDVATLGRVDVELLPDGSAAAAYVEFANQRAGFRVRRVERNGTKSAPITIAGMTGNRTSGLPRMALHGDQLVFAWVDREAGSQVKTAKGVLR
jgi:hypothetical protein